MPSSNSSDWINGRLRRPRKVRDEIALLYDRISLTHDKILEILVRKTQDVLWKEINKAAVWSRVGAGLPFPNGTVRASAKLASPWLDMSPDPVNRGIEEARSGRATPVSHARAGNAKASRFHGSLRDRRWQQLAYRVFARQRRATADWIIEGCCQTRVCAVTASALEARLLRQHDGLLPRRHGELVLWPQGKHNPESHDGSVVEPMTVTDSRMATLLLKDSTSDGLASDGAGATDLRSPMDQVTGPSERRLAAAEEGFGHQLMFSRKGSANTMGTVFGRFWLSYLALPPSFRHDERRREGGEGVQNLAPSRFHHSALDALCLLFELVVSCVRQFGSLRCFSPPTFIVHSSFFLLAVLRTSAKVIEYFVLL
ncbi:hypothetical protein R1flu_013744 [Riccia fluitans]|uniref:Uncharacterized protein n=1 Tax=Riccia fluitans TaxID=41844 RepID=A0ABD1YE42_9MARC